jgi:aryl-alcohol dehydrogenase-like predicted oxidoreductase
VHHPDDLLAENGSSLWEALQTLRRDGLVSKLGVSICNIDQIDRVRDRCHLDIIQLPLNVFDQRLLASGHLDKLKSAGAEIHVRSIFLQGLLLMALDRLPAYFYSLRPKLLDYNQFLEANNLRPLQGALTFVSQLPQIDCAILGVCTRPQLIEILEGLPRDSRRLDFSRFALDDDPRINPVNWRL